MGMNAEEKDDEKEKEEEARPWYLIYYQNLGYDVETFDDVKSVVDKMMNEDAANGGDTKPKSEESQLYYAGEQVFGENNDGENNWSGGGDYARFGNTPYSVAARGANTEWTSAGKKLLTDSWAITISGFVTFGKLPKIIGQALWFYAGGRTIQEITSDDENEN
jgi:hypothetical protein